MQYKQTINILPYMFLKISYIILFSSWTINSGYYTADLLSTEAAFSATNAELGVRRSGFFQNPPGSYQISSLGHRAGCLSGDPMIRGRGQQAVRFWKFRLKITILFHRLLGRRLHEWIKRSRVVSDNQARVSIGHESPSRTHHQCQLRTSQQQHQPIASVIGA